MSRLQASCDVIDELEARAHGVLRVDQPRPTDELCKASTATEALRERAVRRAEEWAAAFGGGHVTLSQPFSEPPPSHRPAIASSHCSCRREAWLVQLELPLRRLQVVAARFSALPPDGRNSQLLDITWLGEAFSSDAGGAEGGAGMSPLVALYSALSPPAENYQQSALAAAMSALDVPPADFAHLRRQPLLFPAVGACEPLTRCLDALGEDLCAWCRLEEPLAPLAADGIVDALRRARTPAVEPPGLATGARADLAVRHWERLDLYVASAVVGSADLGQQQWLATAAANLRARGADGGEPVAATASLAPATPLALLLALARDPRADGQRRERLRQLFEWLSAAPAPAGPEVAAAYEKWLRDGGGGAAAD